MEQIFLEHRFGLRAILLHLLCAGVVCKQIARIETSAVLAPGLQTNPAKLHTATPTRHVIASLILLYRFMAFRTRFSVGNDPRNVLRFRRVFFAPLDRRRACSRQVRLVGTGETKIETTATRD